MHGGVAKYVDSIGFEDQGFSATHCQACIIGAPSRLPHQQIAGQIRMQINGHSLYNYANTPTTCTANALRTGCDRL